MAKRPLPAQIGDLPRYVHDRLEEGASSPGSPFHWPTLATSGSDGPEARSMVLRAYDRDEGSIVLFTDNRGRKADALLREPRAVLHVYDTDNRLQLRLRGEAELHREGPAWQDRWNGVQQGRTSDYAHEPAPGTPIPEADRFEPEGADPAEHFAVIVFTCREADLLELAKDGQRRARLRFGDDGAQAEWIVP